MKYIDWDDAKNAKLKAQRKICFEDVLTAIETGAVLDDISHPQKTLYPSQRVFVIEFNDYVYVVPYIEDKEKFFLKTIYPSRKMTKLYLRKEH